MIPEIGGCLQAGREPRPAPTRHGLDTAPDLAELRAAEVRAAEFVRLVGKLVQGGKGCTAAPVRAHLRAAYSLANRSHKDRDAPLTPRSFGITANPIADITVKTRSDTEARDQTLSAPELVVWRRTGPPLRQA